MRYNETFYYLTYAMRTNKLLTPIGFVSKCIIRSIMSYTVTREIQMMKNR